ncbi:MAG TPA: amino acid permease [Candidatus Gastranaerophilales bacterium]|nr:amino acid permease [Candidatus Gastranaerophilales bacterium]
MALDTIPAEERREVMEKTKLGTFGGILRKKSPEDLMKCGGNKLEKTLTGFDLIILGVGAIIGAGIFALSGTAAAGSAHHIGAGPALMVSLIIAGMACSFAALCYAEFASIIPVAGSAFTYTYATLGEIAAWFIGWMLVLEYIIGNITVVSSWSGYLVNFLKGFEGVLPTFLTSPPVWLVNNYSTSVEKYKHIGVENFIVFLQDKFQALGLNPDSIKETFTVSNFDISAFNPAVFARMGFDAELLLNPASQIPHLGPLPIAINIPAFLIMAFITTFLFIGIKESAKMTFAMVMVKIVVILLFVGVGLFYVTPENWVPFAPNGMKGIFVGAYLMFFAYIGFDAVSTAAEETKNPQKDMPVGIIGSLIICTLIYIVVIAVLTGMVPLSQIDTHAPIAAAMTSVNQHWVAFIISIGAIAGLTSVLLVLQLGGTRILYAMSRDKFLPPIFSKIHPKYKTPYINTLIVGFAVAGLTTVLDLNAAAELSNIGTLVAFMMVCAGVRILRKTDPDRERPFRVPFVPVIPILGILTCIALIVLGLPTLKTLIIFGIWVILGMIVYFSYGYKRIRASEEC